MTHKQAVPAARRRTAVVKYNDVCYLRNLSLCRRALTHRQVEGEFLGGMTDLAQAAGCSRSTATHLLSGRNLSMQMTIKLLDALKLRFEDVHTLLADPTDDH